jgi:hypothetical protein
MSVPRFTHRAGQVLTTTVFAVSLSVMSPDAADAQRGWPDGGSGGQGQTGGARGSGHGHAGGRHGGGPAKWHGGRPDGWRGAGPVRRHGSFGYGPGWALGWGWGWGFPAGGVPGEPAAPSPYAYRFLYDSPYYYPDYDSYHGFSYPY